MYNDRAEEAQRRDELARLQGLKARQVVKENGSLPGRYGPAWDILDVEAGTSARSGSPRPWDEVRQALGLQPQAEEVEPVPEVDRICIWCGKVCESLEALDLHEDDCAPE